MFKRLITFRYAAALAVALLVLAPRAYAQDNSGETDHGQGHAYGHDHAVSSSATTPLLLEVSSELVVSVEQGIDFGRILAGTGDVILYPKTGATSAGVGDAHAGFFHVVGETGADITITYDVQTDLSHEGATIPYTATVLGGDVDDRVSAAAIGSPETLMLHPQTGRYYFWVGGSLHVGNVPVGDYTGQFTFQVQYTSL